MKRYGYIIAIAILSLFGVVLMGEDDSAEIKALLNEAKEITAKASFKSVTTVYNNGKPQKTVNLYRKLADDGTILEKVENIWPDSLKEAYISNKSGTYVFLADSVEKINIPLGNRAIIYGSIDNAYSGKASYSATDDSYRNIPCYKVSVKLPTDQAFVDELAIKLRNGADDAKKRITANFAFEKTYLIGKDNHFIYSCAFYNLEGKKTLSCDWGDVDFKTPLDDGIFITPEGDIAQIDRSDVDKLRYIKKLFNVFSSEPGSPEPQTKTVAYNADNAREILFAAMKETRNASFRAINKETKGGKEYKTVRTFHKPLPDGSINERIEYSWKNDWKETYILNSNGNYAILNNTLVKTDFRPGGSKRFIYENVRNDIIEDASYTMTDGNYKGEPCYQITVKIPTDLEYVKERVKRIQRHTNKSEEELMKLLPYVKTFLVGKKNNFIYSCTSYNLLGRKTSSEEWGNVTFDPPMPTLLFEPPKNASPLPAKTPAKFKQIKERCIALFKDKKVPTKNR